MNPLRRAGTWALDVEKMAASDHGWRYHLATQSLVPAGVLGVALIASWNAPSAVLWLAGVWLFWAYTTLPTIGVWYNRGRIGA